MVETIDRGMYLINGTLVEQKDAPDGIDKEKAKAGTMAAAILSTHDISDNYENMRLKFDSLACHDATYVNVVMTARASGLTEFPVPVTMTNCHGSLCAEGGTINEDDHVYGLSAAKKYGGIFIPANRSIIHQYNREMMAACGKMILGYDSHTRYGAFGTMAVGEGGGEIVKQLLSDTYDVPRPEIVAVELKGSLNNGVGPQDVALVLVGAVFQSGFVRNKVLEFIGDGIGTLSMDTRASIDTMTTETACWSSIWETDEVVRNYFKTHGRQEAYQELHPSGTAYYDGVVRINLSEIKPMIALPFHPSNTYTIEDFSANAADILRETERVCMEQLGSAPGLTLTDKLQNGCLRVSQGIFGGCVGGTFENICAAAAILKNSSACQNYFTLNIYPASMPVFKQIIANGAASDLIDVGAILKPAFCGPCYGVGDVPANNMLSIRHATRNFAYREGSKPADGQVAAVALMDARSIAATARHGGFLTPATKDGVPDHDTTYVFDADIYNGCVYNGFGRADNSVELQYGPNIADWPEMAEMPEHLLLKVACVIHDPVTTTDELMPAGEVSSYRSNPAKISEYALYRKDPGYVQRAKDIAVMENARRNGKPPAECIHALEKMAGSEALLADTGIGSVLYAVKPGDGSAREHAASAQRVLGGCANIAQEYATKRYRTNMINWGLLPFLYEGEFQLENDDYIYIRGIRKAVETASDTIKACYIRADNTTGSMTLRLGSLTDEERQILLCGSLTGYYKARKR